MQLFVSLLTTTTGYSTATTCLLSMALFSFATEYFWIQVVFKRFPILQYEDRTPHDGRLDRCDHSKGGGGSWNAWAKQEKADWIEFSRLPIFYGMLL